ncbi:hypothetical protein ABZ490_46045 [Streptomyces sp. NPDC005811]|uniref:hypothetical protein n=1 Tax=Streptomyces sp. NPDC005811 TaxID=3154565 RepID=UPI0033DB75E4
MHSNVEATVMIAFEIHQGNAMARSGTAKLERTPTPPPKITNLMKESTGPGVAGAAVAVAGFFGGSGARGDQLLDSRKYNQIA